MTRGAASLAAVADPADIYIKNIWQSWQKVTTGIIETGEALLKAKAELPHGSFEKMVEAELPFKASTARRLMAIEEHPLLSDRAHAHALPSSWATLYELTKLPEPVLEKAIEDGTITADFQRKDVAKLRPAPTSIGAPPVGGGYQINTEYMNEVVDAAYKLVVVVRAGESLGAHRDQAIADEFARLIDLVRLMDNRR